MTSFAIGISGGIGSGKTTLASELARTLSVPHASFGRYVKSLAVERGARTEREDLQALGEQLIASQGWVAFVTNTLKHAGWNTGGAVVEGIRHIEARDALINVLAPTPFRLIYVDVPASERTVRVEKRDGMTADRLSRIEAHSTERQVETLRSLAQVVVRGDDVVADVVSFIINRLRFDIC